MRVVKEWKCFGGMQRVFEHESQATGTRMEFAVFEPPGTRPRPVLYFLSGLTCTWENVVTKGGAQCWAVEHDVTLICPDTSPRGESVPDSPGESDLGWGAGFYVNATQEPWSKNYRMFDYVAEELPQVIEPALDGFSGRRGIFGHSMGGHGALILAIRHPEFFHSVSAFSPVVSPSQVPWGRKAFSNYLGDDDRSWAAFDACCLLQAEGFGQPLLVDVGTSDPFLHEQLRPELLENACAEQGVTLELRRQPGYDHSYFFISSFMRDHIAWHSARLR